jgi:hypothetical protein
MGLLPWRRRESRTQNPVTEKTTVYHDADGVRRTLIIDDERPGVVVVHTQQDLEPILDAVHRDRELFAHNGPNKVIGYVPVFAAERAVLEGWDERDWSKWWNGEGRAFRVWNPGGTI